MYQMSSNPSVHEGGQGDLRAHALALPVSRRTVLRGIVGVGAAALATTAIGMLRTVSAAGAVKEFTTTDNLNLRKGPGTQHPVILVMPKGSVVSSTGEEQNRFLAVTYQGTTGWAHRDFLGPAGTGGDPIMFGQAITTAYLNLRTGPSTSHTVLRVIPVDSWVEISNSVRDGFRYVEFDGQPGWAFDEYLRWYGDGEPVAYLTTVTALNLRAEPSLSSRVLLVMPQGARVQATDQVSYGFRQVVYNGTAGWAYDSYLG